MERKHYSFPSIDQYREVVKSAKYHAEFDGKDAEGNPIYNESLPKPVVEFTGTVKLHGTNASIIFLNDGTVQYQSREAVLGPDESGKSSDNSGFYAFMKPHEEELKVMMSMSAYPPYLDYMGVYGEWCGKGIQKGTAINKLDKMFVVFGIKIDDEWYNPIGFPFKPSIGIYNIKHFDTFKHTVDFNDPQASLDELNRVTLEVENECPVGKALGVSGIGEGIVWVGNHVQEDGTELIYRFKTKGEKHSLKVAKEPKAVSLDVEAFESVQDFLDANLSPNRLEQGLSVLQEKGSQVDIRSIGEYIKWAVSDLKKECSMEIEAMAIDEKILNKEASKRAKEYYVNYLNTNL